MSHRFRPQVASAAALIGLLAAAPAALADGPPEQLDRDTGTAGATALSFRTADNKAITDDGRTAYFSHAVENNAVGAAKNGLWRRDLDTNKTTVIATGANTVDSFPVLTGLSNDGRVMSFVTNKKLVAADKNTVADLYVYTAATGAIDLASRADGASGAALGLSTDYNSRRWSVGFVTRDGLTALFGTSTGVLRRTLATGRTVKVVGSDADPLGRGGAIGYPRSDDQASADGSVYIAGPTIVTPTRRIALSGLDPFDSVRLSESGAVAVQPLETPGLSVRVIDTATGASRDVDLGASGVDGSFVGITPDGLAVLVSRSDEEGNPLGLSRVDLATGSATDLKVGTNEVVASRSGRFGVFRSGSAVWAQAGPGASLPGGTADLPSPGAYVSFVQGCRGWGFPFYVKDEPTQLNVTLGGPAVPALRSIAWKTTKTTGATYAQGTATSAGSLPLGVGFYAFGLTLTATFTDGRTATESWSQPVPPKCPTGFGF